MTPIQRWLVALIYLWGLGQSLAPWTPHWLPGLISIAAPGFFLTVLLVVLIWRWRAPKATLALAPWLVLGFCLAPRWIGWHPQLQGNLRVVSMNCNYFQADFRGPVVKNQDAVKPLLLHLRPDVMCLQEYSTDSSENNERIDAILQRELGLRYRFDQNHGTAVFSRYPILAYALEKFPDSQNLFCWVDLQLPKATLRVFNLHLESYGLKLKGSKLKRLISGTSARPQQAERVAEAVAQSPYPVLLCGDLNDTPTSYAYGRLTRQLRDGFCQAGSGLGFTYQGPLPALRIDYILAQPPLKFRGYRNAAAPKFMDHRLVVADLSL